MFELTVISGKGGTGKSSITRALLDCAGQCVASDCDVDAANLHLVLDHTENFREAFISGYDYHIESDKCISCGLCESRCAFDAIQNFVIDPFKCESCGVCRYFCPAEAVIQSDKNVGECINADSAHGPFVYAHLYPGEENSGKLVSRVRECAKQSANESKIEYVLHDGPPGIGCPVIASITGVTAVLIVTEPTITGYEDYLRARELVEHFRIPLFVCVNKAEINPDLVRKIEDSVRGDNVFFAGTVSYDPSFNKAQLERTSVMKSGPEHIQNQIQHIWKTIQAHSGKF